MPFQDHSSVKEVEKPEETALRFKNNRKLYLDTTIITTTYSEPQRHARVFTRVGNGLKINLLYVLYEDDDV